LPDRLKRQVAFLRANPRVDVLGSGAELVGEDGENLGRAVRPELHEELAKKILRENPFIHPSVMVRRRFYDALGGYDERLRRSQDRDLWLRGYRRFRYHNLCEPLIRYRVRSKPSLQTILLGTFVLARAVYRERMPYSRLWFPMRFFLATTLTKAGVWGTRLR
jgi:hypothetical protein